MGLASALSTALTGLTAAETTIDVVGNNIANSNTVAFKSSSAVFASQFLQTQSLGSSPTGSSGGTNPRQIGLGTKVAEITPDFTQGTIEISSNPLDLAVQGEGFFIVEGENGEQLYTRAGQFTTNSENEIVTLTGQRVLGYTVDENFELQTTQLDRLTIPLGTAAVAQATGEVVLEGTLTPTGDIGDTPSTLESVVLSDGSLEVPPNLADSDVGAITPPNVNATTTAADATAGAIGAGTYSYRVTFVDAFGNETPASSELGPITTTGAPLTDQSILLDDIPAADGTTFVDRNIYRTDSSGAGDFYLVGNVGDAGTTSFVDSLDDGTITANDTLDTGSLAQGNYGYYVTYYNTSNGLESRPTALVGPEPVTVDGRGILLTDIPQPATADFDAVRIYRNLSTDDTEYYMVSQLAAGTTSYVDKASDADIEVAGNEVNLDGPSISFGLSLLDVVRRDGATYENVFEEGVLSFTGNKGGRTLDTKELVIDGATTVQDLVNFVEDAFGLQESSPDPNFPIPGNPGGTITADSTLQFIANMGVDNSLDIGLSSFQLTTNSGTLENVSLPFTETQAANGESAVTDFVVYDTLGIPLNVRLTTVLESKTSASTTYRWYAESPDNDPATGVGIAVGTGTVTFDGEGNVSSVSEGTVSIDRRNVSSASPLEFELDFSELSGLASETSSLAASRQDGFAAGTLTSFIIDESGKLVGVFSNGITRDLGQVQLASFANNAGLEQVGDSLYAAGVNSGLPVVGSPGERGIGSVTAGAVELSNTDIGQSLIELILASTQYRGGTRVVTAAQQLLDELLALRR